MKSIFDNNCFVSYPNLIIAQLENSSIIKKKIKIEIMIDLIGI